MFDTEVARLNRHSTFSRTLAQRLSVLILLLAAALLATSCGLLTQPAGARATNNLNLQGTIPAGTVNQSYNAVLTVGGGSFPYNFSVNTGVLPPGISLNPTTGTISGMPTTAGTYSFEVMVTDSSLLDKGSQTFHVGIGRGPGKNVQVGLSPASATLLSNQKHQFTATVSGTSNTGVTWSAATGAVDANGLYTAPAVNTQTNVIVTATSNADSSKSASATVTVDPVSTQALAITTTTLPQGQQGYPYSDVFTATGGTAPYSWSISAGTPPAGTAMNANGDFAGMPTAAGTFNFTVAVTDANSKTATGNFSAIVLAGSNFDGPAELPRVTVPSAMSDTPAPGSVITVKAGDNLQLALNNAQCGDVIEFQAGATYSSMLTLPAKQCDDQHWIIIRTSAPDSALPPEGQRLTPCYAGVASLPNRPTYSCTNPQNVLARISKSVKMGDGPIIFASGANHYRLVGLEITRPADQVGVVALMAPAGAVPADHIVIDRSWIHGTAQDDTRRGVALNGTTNLAIVDSYLNDFHCTSISGTCSDSMTMGGGGGNLASGPWKIENNFLEAAGENILFGGSISTVVPADITIRHNHFYKVPQWQPGSTGFVGGYTGNPFVVKNHFEIKNAARVLFEGNLLEYSWGGFSQSGQSILITPRNDYYKPTSQGNLCSVCEAVDITIRYNRIRHTGGVFNLANVTVAGLGAQASARYSIHDIVADDIDGAKYRGGGGLFMIMNFWTTQTLHDVSIRHVSGFPSAHFMAIANDLSYPEMYNFTFQDNLVVIPAYPVWSAGGNNSCAVSDVPITVISTCFKTYTFANNVLVAVPTPFPPSKWPGGNFFVAAVNDVGFANYTNGNGGDYQLQANSPYKGKASDGTDPGADINALNAAIQGVE
jgi:Putative Ig domain